MRVVTPRQRRLPQLKQRRLRRRHLFLALGLALVAICGIALLARQTAQAPASNEAIQKKATAEAAPSSTAQTEASAKLQGVIDSWVAQHGTGYRIVVQQLGNEQAVGSYKSDVVTVPASTYKLFVAYVAYHQAEVGKISLGSTLSNGKTIEQCIEKAIVQSDNACAEAVGFYVGWDTVDKLTQQAGFTQTKLNNYGANSEYISDKASSAADLSSLLRKLYEGTLVNEIHSQSLLGYMKRQVYRSGIPAGSGASVVADKVGFLTSVTHDAAIVYAPDKPYVLVILSTAGNNWANIKQFATNVHEAVTKL